jgi:indole-3-glycerol phosphate synthase
MLRLILEFWRFADMSQLDRIVATTRSGLEERKAKSPISQLEKAAAAHQPRGFARSLRQKAAEGVAVIAEIKKASPSRGVIRENFDVRALASDFAAAGAAALSILTDEQFFRGSLQNLELASEISGLPCLRKDFILDEFQVLEARAHRADAILLIAAALTDLELRQLAAQAHAIELDILCEVHTLEELDRVLELGLGCEAIGVNNRDLRTFEVRLEVSLTLADRLPAGPVHVSESGIHSGADIRLLSNAGFNAFLVGESLMRQPEPGKALEDLQLTALERGFPGAGGQTHDPAVPASVAGSEHNARGEN